MSLITYLTKIQFEAGACRLLREELAALGSSRPLVVADKGVVAAGLVARVLEASGMDPATPVFDGTPENPTEDAVHEALNMFRAENCDGIVGLGGGSPLDLAKGVSLMATHEGPLDQYAAILGGIPRVRKDKPPVAALPTTAGTGSEVGRAALITLRDGRKLGFISPFMIPDVAICDPELTLGLPPRLTAATGMDALTHCIETYLSPRDNPPAEAIALDGLRRVTANIRAAVADGSDLAARTGMMMAALEGGMTFQKGLGAVHSLSHPMGGLKGVPLHHGTLNAVLLPAVLEFNAPAAGDKYAALAGAMGLVGSDALVDAIRTLNRDLAMPANLRDMGVPEDVLPYVAANAVKDHSTATNARPIEEADFLAILHQSYG